MREAGTSVMIVPAAGDGALYRRSSAEVDLHFAIRLANLGILRPCSTYRRILCDEFSLLSWLYLLLP